MSVLTSFLKLKKWNVTTDANEQFDIETSVNANWDKIDTNAKQTLTHKYRLKITTAINAGTAFTIPCHYKVGANVLDVFGYSADGVGGQLLLSTDDAGTDGHFREVGANGAISNQIKTTSDWSLKTTDVLEFVVRGEYSV